MERRDKINYYLDIAETVAERSTCLRRCYGAIIVNNDEITITANSCDDNSEITYIDFRHAGSANYQLKGSRASSMERAFDLTEEEKTSGIITRKFASDEENFKVYFKNKYGVWVHTMTKIK